MRALQLLLQVRLALRQLPAHALAVRLRSVPARSRFSVPTATNCSCTPLTLHCASQLHVASSLHMPSQHACASGTSLVPRAHLLHGCSSVACNQAACCGRETHWAGVVRGSRHCHCFLRNGWKQELEDLQCTLVCSGRLPGKHHTLQPQPCAAQPWHAVQRPWPPASLTPGRPLWLLLPSWQPPCLPAHADMKIAQRMASTIQYTSCMESAWVKDRACIEAAPQQQQIRAA